MQSVAFTEFRKNASALFSVVEAGEIILVTRHGKGIAEITPWNGSGKSDPAQPSWKGKRTRPGASGKTLSRLILEERENAP
uniref:Antitoxin Phd_YefM, type II toxin-antitoxin system n=1 Tax=Candidatus Kentrum sp. DK TaxID=2126562 RepID=A0A450S0R2_9GAMM|nr:MAG: Antitoxin Phd_YefM, type II toxin-antitoxin system [Candidatus Kentron sp. DK]VFJ56975.1 MAG: Antitoxin Phd_YefM, type II toxin-antitoxin system [Candidatus Kentron sp. DK]